jgi:hypothetical protein
MATAKPSYRASEDTPMAIFQQNLPASLRFGSPSPQETRGIANADRRPYLLNVPTRKPFTATRQPVNATRQFLALFPHESEDARITGATRSLYRRLLALNLPRPVTRAESPSDLHDPAEPGFRVSGSKIA